MTTHLSTLTHLSMTTLGHRVKFKNNTLYYKNKVYKIDWSSNFLRWPIVQTRGFSIYEKIQDVPAYFESSTTLIQLFGSIHVMLLCPTLHWYWILCIKNIANCFTTTFHYMSLTHPYISYFTYHLTLPTLYL